MRLTLLFSSLLALGCGGARATPLPATAQDPGYPAGPYDYAFGSVIPDLLFAGKTIPVGGDAAMVPWQMLSLGGLRAGGTRALVIEVGAEWCSDCVGDQPAMMQLESDYAAKGVVGVELLSEAAIGVAPTMDNLDRWCAAYNVSGTVALDARLSVETAADIVEFPTYLVVDATTMKIEVRSTAPLTAMPLGPTLDVLLANGT